MHPFLILCVVQVFLLNNALRLSIIEDKSLFHFIVKNARKQALSCERYIHISFFCHLYVDIYCTLLNNNYSHSIIVLIPHECMLIQSYN